MSKSPMTPEMVEVLKTWLRESDNAETGGLRYATLRYIEWLEQAAAEARETKGVKPE